MYYNIYEIDTAPITDSQMDAMSVGEHIIFIGKCAVVDDLEDKERSKALQEFGKWLKKEKLGELRKSTFILNEDVRCGQHFANRYIRFHQLAEALFSMTEADYLQRFHDIRNLTSDLQKTVVDDDDDHVMFGGSLLTMDEFLRRATPGLTYHIGSICKYHC